MKIYPDFSKVCEAISLEMIANEIIDHKGDVFALYHTDIEPDIRDLHSFVPVERMHPKDITDCQSGGVRIDERWVRFFPYYDMPFYPNAGSNKIEGSTLYSSHGAQIDVYEMWLIDVIPMDNINTPFHNHDRFYRMVHNRGLMIGKLFTGTNVLA